MKYLLPFIFLFCSCHSQNNERSLNDSLETKNDRKIDSVQLIHKKHTEEKTHHIFFSDSIFKFSNYTKKSKVTVFVISSETCVPCHVLIDKLEKKISSDSLFQLKLELFVIKIPNSRKEKKEYESIGYQVFKNIDNFAEVLPTTFIFSPTENQYSKIVGEEFIEIDKQIETLIPFCK